MYDNLKKFADKKQIKFDKQNQKSAYQADKKGKTLTANERNDLVLLMAKDLGYLS